MSDPAPKLIVKVTRAEQSDRLAIRNMIELYLHDLSEFDLEDVENNGLFGFYFLDYFWHKPNYSAFVFRVNEKYAGFALVNDRVVFTESEQWMAQFFVLRKYRRGSVGSTAAIEIFNLIPARWEVAQEHNNLSAQKFWTSVISSYTKGKFIERSLSNDMWNGPIQLFSSVSVKDA